MISSLCDWNQIMHVPEQDFLPFYKQFYLHLKNTFQTHKIGLISFLLCSKVTSGRAVIDLEKMAFGVGQMAQVSTLKVRNDRQLRNL